MELSDTTIKQIFVGGGGGTASGVYVRTCMCMN